MDYEFHSQLELFQRVQPALHVKEEEFQRLGYLSIHSVDIWNYLIETRWKMGHGLMLSDIVDDILNTDCHMIYDYWEKKKSSIKESSFEDISII